MQDFKTKGIYFARKNKIMVISKDLPLKRLWDRLLAPVGKHTYFVHENSSLR